MRALKLPEASKWREFENRQFEEQGVFCRLKGNRRTKRCASVFSGEVRATARLRMSASIR